MLNSVISYCDDTGCKMTPFDKNDNNKTWYLWQTSVKFQSKFKYFHSRKCIWKCRLQNVGHFVSGWMCYEPIYPHICVSESGQRWSRKWLVAYSAPSQYLSQYWVKPLGIKFSETRIKIPDFSFTKMRLKMSSVKRRPFVEGKMS